MLIVREAPIPGLLIIQPQVFGDERGWFLESWRQADWADAGIASNFVQDNVSSSRKGVLRGLHFQKPPFAQGKLLAVLQGAVWDVAVDIRSGSPSYGQWYGLELSAQNHTMLYVPAGFAHGFVALADDTLYSYKCTAPYIPASEGGIRWNDPQLNIDWPTLGQDFLVSPKDAALPFLKDLP